MAPKSWQPGTLLELSGSYWQAFTLHAGVKLDLFTLLSSEDMSEESLAAGTGADLRGVTMLLNALSAMGLLKKKGTMYAASAEAKRFLNRSSTSYIGHMIMHHHHLAASWAQMDGAVMSGKPIKTGSSHSSEDRRESFLMGMYNIASQQAPQLASRIDLANCDSLLDLGGGPGTYAIHFCKLNPELSAVVYDLPTTQPFASKTIALHGLKKRITFQEGDYVSGSISGNYDAVWISHILHAEGPKVCEEIIQKAVRALNPGGRIIIHDFILNDTMDGPLFPALFALNMLQGTDEGQSYSESQIRDMLLKAGVSDIFRLDYVGPTESGVMVGTIGR